jgi:G3E family GTPase
MSIAKDSTVKKQPCRVIIIAGFLGSGKTTLLKRFIDWEAERREQPYVIMSEFGDIDVDGLLLDARKIKLTSITGGCACCDLREELVNAVENIVKEERGTTVFIESTGVGDPAGIIEAVNPIRERGDIEICNVIVVYDAARNMLAAKDVALIRQQLKTADNIIVNKADLLAQADVAKIIIDIADINPRAEITVTSFCSANISRMLIAKSGVDVYTTSSPTSDSYRSVGFQIDDPLSKTELLKWLNRLPQSVLRAKGFVELKGYDGTFEVQAANGSVNISPFVSTLKPDPMLILITHPMRTDGLVKGLQRCIA